MSKQVVEYARVSTEIQGEKVSIDQQSAEIRALCTRNGWEIVGTFKDAENYKATQQPHKGKIVNPSGERADRPQFLAMLALVKTGEIDAIVCWRDDRLVRHPRVAVALEDALDLADTQRNGKGKVELYDATGATIDRFVLNIKATIGREDNKRRAERVRIGKVGTLQMDRWPGTYNRMGYVTRRELDKRGRIIELGDPAEVQTVKDIFTWYDSGVSCAEIRRRLMTNGAGQRNGTPHRREWDISIIRDILHCEDYTGRAAWVFADGTALSIEIPAIIPHDLWQRVQHRIESNRKLSTHNTAGGVYLLQDILYCGDCNAKMRVKRIRYFYHKMADGTNKRYTYNTELYEYRCQTASRYWHEHAKPCIWAGSTLDWEVWRYIVDHGIKQPETIRDQVLARQARLQAEGDSYEGEIAKAERKLEEIDEQRAFYQRQAGRGKMTEREFDTRMDETKGDREYWQGEVKRLTELRDGAARVTAGLDYTFTLLSNLQHNLAEVDMEPQVFKALSKEAQQDILKRRQTIVRALVDRVVIRASGNVTIEGVLDGSELAQLKIGDSWTDFFDVCYSLPFSLSGTLARSEHAC